MDDIRREVQTFLERAAEKLAAGEIPGPYAREMEQLAAQVEEPCVVAVVGRVKAGKSTFINALLKEDLAKVGVTETTATVNRFVFGMPENPSRPIRCYWSGGRITSESREFLDQLQGNDLETLRRAEGIECLEYLLPNELLREITLVDTPGTGALVDDHAHRLEEFLHLQQRLAARNTERTERLRSDADAVVYLVGAVPRADDKEFLEAFTSATGGASRALNAVGVMSKVDLEAGVLERRHELSQKIAFQLRDNLNTVLPVSAALERALSQILEDENRWLEQFPAMLRTIPPQRIRMLLEHEEFFLEEDFPDCPVTIAQRQRWRDLLTDGQGQPLPWATFALVAQTAADPQLTVEGLRERLARLSGFQPLLQTLRLHFFQRGRLLRAFRIVSDARRIINRLRFECIPAAERTSRKNRPRLATLLEFLDQAAPPEDVREDLESMIRERYDTGRQVERLRDLWEQLDEELGDLWHHLEDENANFEALQTVDDHADLFTAQELDELRSLFGQHGLELERRLRCDQPQIHSVRNQQLRWKQLAAKAGEKPRQLVCRQAERCYASLLYQMRRAGAR